MPKLNHTNLQQFHLAGSHYGYSALPVNALTATEYTLAALIVDGSGSTCPYRREMQQAVRDAIEGCQKHARGDNMMVRVVEFDETVAEYHGFKMVKQCHLADYDAFMRKSGGTALYDSSFNAIESLLDYAKQMSDQDYDVNAIAAVITDGADLSLFGQGGSKFGPGQIRMLVEKARGAEYLESLRLVLVGLNPTKSVDLSQYLQKYADEAGFDQVVEIEDLSPARFAKLGGFLSQSISSQSSSLGTGGPSKPINASQLTF